MGYTDSPLEPQNSDSKKAAFKQLKTLFLQVFRWTKGVLDAQKLPHIANKACEVYLSEADAAHQNRCRRLLRTRLALNPIQLQRFFHTSVGDALITWFARFFHLPSEPNSRHTLRDLLLQMATDPEGLSILSFLRRFPDPIQLNMDQLLFTAKRVELLLRETDATIETIRELSAAECTPGSGTDFTQLPDIRQRGPFPVKRYRLVLQQPYAESAHDHADHRPLPVFCYQPQPLPAGDIPVVVQSHGLASNPEDLAAYAEHLASYGYFVAAPQHPGSDTEQVRNMLAGNAPEMFKLTEFVDRPRDISFLLDELTRRNPTEFENKLNLKAVGMMGYSFGSYTAFALAGADIHFERLEMACGDTIGDPNLSLLLQCQALGLPRQSYTLHDDRIQAILSMDSVGSEVFGQQGIEKVQIPVLLIAGSQDTAAPLALEQVRIFQWLTTPHHFLALLHGKSHAQDMQRLVRILDLQIKLSSQSTLKPKVSPFEQYTKALSLAFFNQHLAKQPAPLPDFSADYAAYLSQPPFDLWLISQASSQTLKHRLQVMENQLVAEVMKLETELGTLDEGMGSRGDREVER